MTVAIKDFMTNGELADKSEIGRANFKQIILKKTKIEEFPKNIRWTIILIIIVLNLGS